MTFGETIHLVVVDDDGNIDIPSDGMDKVITPFPVNISISALSNDRQLKILNVQIYPAGAGP